VSKYRRAAKIDANQPEIVAALRQIPGCMVQPGHDDILVGYKGRTYWFEIKEPGCVSKVTGLILESEKKPAQKVLEASWTGHYKIVSRLDEILAELGLGL
jgi:hypothetical protein